MTVRILIGDMRERLKELPDASVDSCVTDPPYHLTSIVKRFGAANAAPAKTGKTGAYERASRGFMGQTWDGGDVAFDPATWAEVFRILKPGAHLVAFSGTRTYHRMATAIEAAGFEVRDMLSWNFGSGFPKSHNVLKVLVKSGLACSCPKTIVSHHCVSDENLHDLRSGLAAHNALPIGEEPDVRQGVLCPPDRTEAGRPAAEGSAVIPLQSMRKTGASPAISPSANGQCVLQQFVSVEDVRRPAEVDGGQHEGPKAGTPIRRKESGVEGRSDVQAPEGELQGRPVCESAGLGEADGPQGRLHDGAPSGDGEDVRLSADPDGGGQPHRPQPVQQSSEQPGTVADQCGPQAWGGWPVCPGCCKPVIPEGLGTALKPAHEPICLARKTLVGTVAANVLEHGTGEINIDGCRIRADDGEHRARPPRTPNEILGGGKGTNLTASEHNALGRWPANLCHDGSDEVLAHFPETASGTMKAGTRRAAQDVPSSVVYGGDATTADTFGDPGSAARFFYTAKADSSERHAGCEDLEKGNNHPTVKPVDLMRWLCRLVTPKGGTVLDPFMGSGSTMIAADAEQFHGIGCELSPEYVAIAERRIRASAGMFAEVRAA